MDRRTNGLGAMLIVAGGRRRSAAYPYNLQSVELFGHSWPDGVASWRMVLHCVHQTSLQWCDSCLFEKISLTVRRDRQTDEQMDGVQCSMQTPTGVAYPQNLQIF